ncbi:MAG TPA: tyrosine-type recombinase/integrase [Usitatibacter sp.]|nr:tyrosine-type recombinase/integrase [Usitatibacter sp.]
MARIRTRKANGVEYWELGWFGPDIDSATGKKNRHSRLLGRRDAVPKRDAELALKHLQRELFLYEHGIQVPSSPTVDSWRSEYLSWHAAEFPDSHYRTRQILEQHIPAEWAMRHLDSITDRDIEDLKTAWRAAGYRDHTVTKHLRTVKAWLTRAAEKKIITASPAAAVSSPKILDSAPHLYYARDELEALYLASSFDPHHPDEPQHAPWHAPAWKWLANTGLRRGEALKQRRDWVAPDHLRVLSTSEDRTKSGKWREVPLFPGALEALEALDALLGARDYVLPRVTPPSLSRAAGKCIARASLPGSIHTLRHTFVSHLAMDPNVPVRTIQQWAGHASLKTTEGYMHLRRGTPPVALAL